MGAGDVTPGRRVESIDDLEQPGDYYLNPNGPSLWFLLPRVESCPEGEPEMVRDWWDQFWTGRHRIPGDGQGWKLTDESDGTVTASPSILTYTQSGDDGRLRTQWHGWLEHGQWREC